MTALDFTHDPKRRSFVATANLDSTAFPIQNLAFGIFHRKGEDATSARGGVAIGDSIVDLKALVGSGFLVGEPLSAAKAAIATNLNDMMAMGAASSRALRAWLSLALDAQVSVDIRETIESTLIRQDDVVMHLPARIGAFTDFFTSAEHASRAGRMSRPDQPLPPAFRHMPMGYNGRASAVRVGGDELARPWGIAQRQAGEPYRFGPTEALDFELELGAYVGKPTGGEMVTLDQARAHLFGLCLVNDWSAHDIQRAESFPLGPFLSKSAATSVSPWVVTIDALAPFRLPVDRGFRSEDAPPHLQSVRHQVDGGLSIRLTMSLLTERMRAAGEDEQTLTRTDARHLYWSFEQMLTHQASAGCPIEPGDLMGSGTASGSDASSAACLYELCIDADAARFAPLELANGERRLWLEDGDEVILRGWAERPGARAIGFGECRTRIAPARNYPTRLST